MIGFVPENSATLISDTEFPAQYNDISLHDGKYILTKIPHHFHVGDPISFHPGTTEEWKVSEIRGVFEFAITPIKMTRSNALGIDLPTVMFNLRQARCRLPNICEGQSTFPDTSILSGPREYPISKDKIVSLDNNTVLVHTDLPAYSSLLPSRNVFRVSSGIFGYDAVQTNLVNDVSLRYINLQGDTSLAITLPDIPTNYHSNKVQNIWAKIQLSDVPTSDLFNVASTKTGTIRWPSPLRYLKIRIVDMLNNPVNFQGLNYSFTVYITTTNKGKFSHKLFYQ